MVARGRDAGVTESPEKIVIVSAWLDVAPFASVARTVKLDVPPVVGVPLITPVPLLRVSPKGRLPATIAHVTGDLPPVDVSVWLYARFTVPSDNSVVVTDSAAYTVIESALSEYAPLASITRTVKFDVPAAVGVPLITPVAVFRFNPAGRLPVATDQLYGVLPPVADNV